MEAKDVESDADDWCRVPGWVLFAVLMVIYTNFILLSGNTRLSYLDRLIRISPLHCSYDILHCMIELGSFILTGMRPDADEQYDCYLNLRLDGRGTFPGLVLKFVTVMSLLVLWTLRNAFPTQVLAVLYLLHWITNTCFTLDWRNLSVERKQHHCRTAGVLFAFIAYCTLKPGIGSEFGLGTQTQILIDGLAAGTVAGSTYACPVVSGRNPTVSAFVGQLCAFGFACMTWSFGFSPTAVATQFDQHRTAREDFLMGYAPAVTFHVGALCFLLSRRSLEVARPWMKAVVGSIWLGAGAFYYCWFYEGYRLFDVPLAEGRGLQMLLGYSSEVGRDGL